MKLYFVLWKENNETISKMYKTSKAANKKACDLLTSDKYNSDMDIKVMTYQNNVVTNIEEWN